MSQGGEDADALRVRAAAPPEPALADGIDEVMIARLVHAFYAKVRDDEVLAPIFASRVTEWAPHLERMRAFWSSVMLHTGRYAGRPMQKHAPLPVGGAHFDRWLRLFAETAAEVCPPAAAHQFVARARMIAASLEFGIATHRGQEVGGGRRLRLPGA